MPDQRVFSEQAEKFTMVVHALLQNQETRTAFTKEPLAILRQYGIDFKDQTVARKVEAELLGFLGRMSMPNPDDIWPPRYHARSATAASSITWVAKGNLEDLINVDSFRVDAFINRTELESKITALGARVAGLEAMLIKQRGM